MNNSEVGHEWWYSNGGNGSGSNFFYEGDTIYSYGYHFPIARKINSNLVLITNQSYSVTTSRHISYTEQSIPYGVQRIFVNNPLAQDKAQHKDNYKAMKSTLKELIEGLARTREGSTRDWALKNIFDTIYGMNSYTKLFKLGYRQVPDFVFSEADNKALAARLRKKRAKELAVAKKKNQKKIEDWKAGLSYDLYGVRGIYLRVKDDMVESSHSARISIPAAKRIWKAVCKVRASGEEFRGSLSVGKYNLRQITTAGDITVGCHKIEYAELLQISKELGLKEGNQNGRTKKISVTEWDGVGNWV